jgi:hypothetical protein
MSEEGNEPISANPTASGADAAGNQPISANPAGSGAGAGNQPIASESLVPSARGAVPGETLRSVTAGRGLDGEGLAPLRKADRPAPPPPPPSDEG